MESAPTNTESLNPGRALGETVTSAAKMMETLVGGGMANIGIGMILGLFGV